MWDTIVLGSGISGLCAAAALAHRGQRVLVLEQHTTAGGQTQTFQRQGWTFATGVHYIGGVGPHAGAAGQFGRLLAWLSNGALAFNDCGNPYDIVRLPGFEFAIEHPQARYRDRLLERFPQEQASIDRWFAQMDEAQKAAMSLFALRALPAPLAWALKLWRGAELERLSQRTLAQALAEVAHPQLRAVLGARWGDYGALPEHAPLLEHALVTGSYNHGAYFPAGGPAQFAQALLPVVQAAGGAIELGASVTRILVDDGRACGVEYVQRGQRQSARASQVISAMGAHNTAACLGEQNARDWQAELRAFKPGLAYLSLYVGLEGDIAAAGASAANVWIYESVDVGQAWLKPDDEDAPGLFVSFPSLKDPAAGGLPTAEVLALCDASAFAAWMDLPNGERPETYLALKAWVEERLLAQFLRHFPKLAPMVRFHELATPVTQQHFVRAPQGAMYGLEMDAHRLGSKALNVRTPIAGLLLAGQDVSGAGIQASAMSGLMAAVAIEPALMRHLGG